MDNVAVLEIGTSKLCVLIGSEGSNGNFVIASEYQIPYGGYYDGKFVEPEKLGDAIKETLNKAEISSGEQITKLFVGVPAAFCLSTNKNFTKNFAGKIKLTEDIINEIYMEFNDMQKSKEYILISCSPIQFLVDDGRRMVSPLGIKTTRLSGLINYIYAEYDFISTINNILKSYGISVVEYLSAPLSEVTYLLPQQKREMNRIVVDCGFINTTVSVVRGNGLTFLGSFSVGGAQITSDLSECLGYSYKEAEQLKRQLVLSVEADQEDYYQVSRLGYTSKVPMVKSNQIAMARLDMICALITKCLGDYPNYKNQVIYITGGGVCFIKGAKEYMSKVIGADVELLVPLAIQYQKPNYSEVVGLLNSAINQEKKKKVSFIKSILNLFGKK